MSDPKIAPKIQRFLLSMRAAPTAVSAPTATLHSVLPRRILRSITPTASSCPAARPRFWLLLNLI